MAKPRRLFAHVLLYHAVNENPALQQGAKLHNVSPDVLYQQLSWIKQNFDVVDLDSLTQSDDREGKCSITFDDAYKCVFTNALPVLESLSLPASVFVIGSTLTGKTFWRDKIRILFEAGLVQEFIDWADSFCRACDLNAGNFYKQSKNPKVNSAQLDRLLSTFLEGRPEAVTGDWNLCVDEACQLVDHPLLTLGNHTENHYVLASLSRSEQVREIRRNAQLLRSLNKKTTRVFSVPFGGIDSLVPDTCAILADEGYAALLLSRSRLNHEVEGPLTHIARFPALERYMPVASLTGFQRQVTELIEDAEQRVRRS